ncbi:hypothetical protein Nepgr_027068 [Nepenthes gracilis]|uniref:RRM domain-containing protein n=1 Tax=Nepenthes gracilis TaxID=150966 RepID=A0AAD3T976_NEPGR|nr:hypothetical protein Nepgr_027068 [Nepenthes gracilis]
MAYYPPPPPPGIHSSHHPYYQQPPPPPLVIVAPPPSQQMPPPPPAVVPQQTHLLPAHYQPPPLSSYAQHISLPQPSHDEVRTLFVAGLPEDVKAREIYNLFREFPGYESSNLRPATQHCQPFAFAVFSDQQSAVAAVHALNGMVFDLEKGSTLYIDLAKSNSRSKRPRTDDDGHSSDKKFKASPAFLRGSVDPGVGSFHIPGMGNSAYDMIGYPSAQSHLSFDSRIINQTSTAKLSNSSASRAPQNNTPCPTLFVANLGPTCTEQELTQVFSRCRGFLKLKIQSTYGAPVAFVDFQDTASSTEALAQLQGAVLYSSPGGEGMRLEYAKSRMGMRRKPK